ncbi:unconventional prefoldin RPB5 interactor-like [Montipora capricornis]|uniref:unconventional prefoldin RPB5 interactor-like n=1 Tax=Montipora capricornis TaxID=246305 RepID=UPI0035F10523
MSEFAQISRLQEENKKALLERQQRLHTCEKYKEDYEKLEELLRTLPQKTAHEVMVPVGSVAFMPGKLVHTNEITVLLGDNWFAERSASQAVEIVARRKKYLENNIAGIKQDIESFDARLKFAEDIQSVAEEKSDIKEIKENLSQQDEERLLNRGVRKAHPKAERFGGCKKVEGLKQLGKKKTVKGKMTTPPSGEVLSLLARLDELEKKETANAELDQLDDFDENEKSTPFDNDVRWEQPSTDKDKKSSSKRIKWKDCVSKKVNEKNGDDSDDDSSGDENDDNGDDDDVTTITVKFSSLCKSTPLENQEGISGEDAVITPADIYSQFTPKQELKSILKKPCIEEKEQQNWDKVPSTRQAVITTKESEKEKEEFNFPKAFTGTIVEKPLAHQEQQNSSASQMSTSDAGKKPSRFKASRQKHQ